MNNDPKMPQATEELNLFNICKGAVPEVFARELGKVLENMADVNTLPSKPRSITLTFSFAPFADRSGAMVSMGCKSTLGALDASDAMGNIFVVRRPGNKVSAYSRDVRQELLFGKEQPAVDGKSAGAADKVVGIGG